MFSTSRGPSGRRDSIGLLAIPLAVAFVLGALLLPRRADPLTVPLPVADARALERVTEADRRLAEKARLEPLPGSVRALGSAIREFHTREARDATAGPQGVNRRPPGDRRRAIDSALAPALQGGDGGLLELRAVELEGFLEQVRKFQASGTQSPELEALAGDFVRSMTLEGWCRGHELAAREPVLRAMFKRMWNTLLGLESRPAFALTLDENRTLYAFYLSHPHPQRAMRAALAAARRGARDARACQAIAEAERTAIESWRLERIAQLETLDPTYPAAYARGVASFLRGDFVGSAAAFQAWLAKHPGGPLALRAENHLRAALAASQVQ